LRKVGCYSDMLGDRAVFTSRRTPVDDSELFVGEAKWARKVDGARILRDVEQKSSALPRVSEDLRFAVCMREEVDGPEDLLPITAEDTFG
jgi:hypothetical protein